ncbi:Uncharacterised protein [uncultured archaeon]|nr:Uncharacterised protein [uncultured archaeon]
MFVFQTTEKTYGPITLKPVVITPEKQTEFRKILESIVPFLYDKPVKVKKIDETCAKLLAPDMLLVAVAVMNVMPLYGMIKAIGKLEETGNAKHAETIKQMVIETLKEMPITPVPKSGFVK